MLNDRSPWLTRTKTRFIGAACLLIIFMAMWLCSHDAYSAQLQTVAIEKSGQSEQLVLRTAGTINKPRVFSLHNPYRVIVDLPNTQLSGEGSKNSIINARGDVVRGIRYGVLHSTDLRLVLDMASTTSLQPQLSQRSGSIQINFAQGAAPSASTTSDTGATSSTTAHKKREIVIAVDPGHGGKDSGTVGRDGTYEKNVVLPIGRYMVNYINQMPGFRAFLTRTDDSFLTLPQRVVVARKHKADFFVSIHANAVDSTSSHGTIVFALSEHGATSTMANWMAKRENTSTMLNGGGEGFLDLSGDSIPLRQTLIDLSLSSKTEQSITAGESLVKSISQINSMFTSRVERANFAVLRSPDIPAVLVETDFLSNPRARQNLKSPAFQRKMGQAIGKGMINYFEQHPRGQ